MIQLQVVQVAQVAQVAQAVQVVHTYYKRSFDYIKRERERGLQGRKECQVNIVNAPTPI